MNKKGIVTLIIILLLVVMVTDFRINGADVFQSFFYELQTDSMNSLNNNFNITDTNAEHVEKTFNLLLSKEDIEKLEIINNLGSIDIIGEDRDDIQIETVVTVYAMTEVQAGDYLKTIELKHSSENGLLNLYVKHDDIPSYIRGIKADYIIKAPAELELNLRNKFGKLKVENFAKDIKLVNAYDSTLVNYIDGNADINASYGNLYVNSIKGKTTVDCSYNKTSLKKLESDLVLEADFCEVQVENVSGSSEIDARYGRVDLRNMAGKLTIDSAYTDVTVSLPEDELEADLEYGDFDLDPVKNNVDIKSRYTDVSLNLAPGLEDYQLECRTEYADINTNLPLEIKKEGQERTLSGGLGNGDIEINIDASYGNVVINK